jgi:hypothetical protein
MTSQNDTTRLADLKARDDLRRAAERVMREYRGKNELETEETAEGTLVKVRPDLAVSLDKLEDALNVQSDTAEVSGSEASKSNAVQAFMTAVEPLSGCCFCDEEGFQHGRELVAVMASRWNAKADSFDGPLLSVEECADVLDYVHRTQAREDTDLGAWGRSNSTAEPSYGLYSILAHVWRSLKGGAA